MTRKDLIDSRTRLVLVSFVSALALTGQSAFPVSGVVSSVADGSAIAGLNVTAVQMNAAAGATPIVLHGLTGVGGTFNLSAPAGAYRLCVEEALGYLDPCQWSPGSSDFSVASAAKVQIALRAGVRLIIRLNDPQGKVQNAMAAAASATAPPLSAFITDSAGIGRLIPYHPSVGPVYEFARLVPADQFTLNVQSSLFQLADPTGVNLPGSAYQATIDTSATTPQQWNPISKIGFSTWPSRIIDFTVGN
jgi:hypothetical protein